MKTPIVCFASLLFFANDAEVHAQSTVLISHFVNSNPDYDCYGSGSISADGRTCAFVREHLYNLFPELYETTLYVSYQSNLLVFGYDNGFSNFYEWNPQVSADGRFVAFTDRSNQVYVSSVPTGPTFLVSANSQGSVANFRSNVESISATGRFVGFLSLANNLEGGVPGLFIRDVTLSQTEAIDVNSIGVHGNAWSSGTSISDDGRFVAFSSQASNLVPNDTNGRTDIFVRDRLSGTTECVSLGLTGNTGNNNSVKPSMSADGRFVAFASTASDLVANDTNNASDIFVRDRVAQVTRRVSLGAANAQGLLGSDAPSISVDGRFVAFQSLAPNLVVPDYNAANDIFVRDRLWHTTELVSVGFGSPGSASSNAHISAGGRYVLFEEAGNVFMRDRGAALSHTYCTGDGAATVACPCGNNSALGSQTGCLNSLGIGARLFVTGESSLANDTLVLHGNGMPDTAALCFQGTAAFADAAGAVFGDGLRCVGGTLVRLAPKQNVAGSSAYPGASDPSVSLQGHITTIGSRYYQVRYRNSASFCTTDTFNLSNGLELIWSP